MRKEGRLRGRIIEEDHYYAFGLKIAGISSNKLGNDTYEGYLQNKNLYNDKELIDEADFDWYDYGFRNYDPQIGRFPQLDPITDDYPELTPFQYGSNDPIANIDLDGLEGTSSIGSFITPATQSTRFWLPQAAQLAKTTETVTKVGMSLSSAALRVGLVAANEGLRIGLDGQKASDIERRLQVNQVKEINKHWVHQEANKYQNTVTGQIWYKSTAAEAVYPEVILVPLPKFGWAFKLLGRGGEAVAGNAGESIAETIVATGQRHHLLSNKILQALKSHPTLGGIFNREDSRFIYNAFDETAHKGYQTWHRQYDKIVVDFLQGNPNLSKSQFETFLQDLHQQPWLKERIPNVNLNK